MRIHHMGYAVKDMEISINEFLKLGFVKYREKIIDTKRKIMIQFMNNGEYLIELVAPLAKNSPIDNIIKKMGDSPYHICYEVAELNTVVDHFIEDQYILITKPEEAVAFSNRKVVFLFKKGVGVIELLEGDLVCS